MEGVINIAQEVVGYWLVFDKIYRINKIEFVLVTDTAVHAILET